MCRLSAATSSKAASPLFPKVPLPANTEALVELIFNPALAAKRVNQTEGADLIATSANNLYGAGLTQSEVEAYYNGIKKPGDLTPVSYGLNTRLRKVDGKIVEEPYKVGGLYSNAIEHIVANLDSASAYAENDAQRQTIRTLIDFYTTGDLATFDKYSIEWAGGYRFAGRLYQRLYRELRRPARHDRMGVDCQFQEYSRERSVPRY